MTLAMTVMIVQNEWWRWQWWLLKMIDTHRRWFLSREACSVLWTGNWSIQSLFFIFLVWKGYIADSRAVTLYNIILMWKFGKFKTIFWWHKVILIEGSLSTAIWSKSPGIWVNVRIILNIQVFSSTKVKVGWKTKYLYRYSSCHYYFTQSSGLRNVLTTTYLLGCDLKFWRHAERKRLEM